MSRLRVGLLAVAVCLTGCAGIGAQTDAEMACESAVKSRLKHPDVADFEHQSYTAASGGPAKVRGYVKTVNGFNAPTRVTYSCEVSGGRATVELYEP